jgi:mannose-6-phosphate isomerase-like protein (cupin superfamily)
MATTQIPAPNRPAVSLSTLQDAHKAYSNGSWIHRAIDNEHDIGDVLWEAPGTAVAAQWRPNADEFVAIVGGRYEVEIEELGTFSAEEDSYFCIPMGHAARFAVQGREPGVRVSVRLPSAQALPQDNRTPAERRSAHSTMPTPTPKSQANGKGPAPNQPHISMAQLKEHYGPAPWSHQVIANQSYMTNFIYAKPHDLPAGHWHTDCDEWWLIREGGLEWVFDGIGAFQVKKGDIVCAPVGYLHRIHVIGDVPGIRMPTVKYGFPSVPHLPPEVLGHRRRGLPGYPG